MTIQEINKAYNRIIGSLDEKELKNAFDFLQGLIAGIREYSFQDRLNELQDTYKIYGCDTGSRGLKIRCKTRYTTTWSHPAMSSRYSEAQGLIVDSPLSYYSRRRMMQKELTNYDQLHKVLRNASLVKIETPTGTITEQQQIESANDPIIQ